MPPRSQHTTQRVKSAFLRLNLDTLSERVETVRARIDAHRCWLASAPLVVSEAYEPPPPGEVNIDDDVSNPNALCVPLSQDYDVGVDE